MFTTVITDCFGENEKGRQIARFNSLGLGPSDLIGVASNFSSDATIEGGANLIDILDATEGKKGVVVLNVAPRGDKNEGSNGNNFCYFYHKQTLVVSTVKGYCLSFVKKFDLAKQINILELSDVLNWAVVNNKIKKNQSDYILKTQFRSFDFVPRLVRWLVDGHKIPSTNLLLATYNLPPACVWHIDAFGNAKLTLTNKEFYPDLSQVETNVGIFPFYERLKDLKHGETALYIGSSGIKDVRFLELATQGIPGSATRKLNLKIGDTIEFKL